ncbi:MAG: ATP-binding protein [Wenzhouxiangellaceae bacterium]|nr:ATP-binding protein [Wenzhouxiangellaceae bacterium]
MSDTHTAATAELASMVDWITEATLPVTGDDFFRQLTQTVATRMGVDTVLITHCPRRDEGLAETLAYWQRGHFQPNVEFELEGTPCRHVLEDGEFSFYPDGAECRFPEWSREEGQVRSFIGIPVREPGGQHVIGHIAIYHGQPMQDMALLESVFRVLAMRVGAEIRRREAVEREHQLMVQLAAAARRESLAAMGSAISHEIRQPLTAIVNHLNAARRLLATEAGSSPRMARALDGALASAERGVEVVTRLRSWLQPGGNEFRRQSIAEVVDEALELLRPELRAAHCRLQRTRLDDDCKLDLDRVLIQQVVINLIRNAIEAVERAGSTTREIELQGRRVNGEVEIRVRDSGCGLSDDQARRLFRPFESGRDGGMGIGLTLSRSIIESHGGQLWHDPDEHLTTFVFSLPLPDSEQ